MFSLGSLWGKLQAGAAALGLFIVAIGIAVLKGRAEGIRHMEAEQQRKRDALQDEYDQIDAGPIDVGGAYDRLRGLQHDKDRR